MNRDEALFYEAMELGMPAAGVMLDQECVGDENLRQRVERLLAAHAGADSLLDGGPNVAAATCELPSGVFEKAGDRIGPYKLIQQLGEGGMGVVYMAQQTEPVKRLVALKIIKPGMDSRQVIARFEAERQALALMEHPNIARIFDAGMTAEEGARDSGFGAKGSDADDHPSTSSPQPQTPAGRPYFVMELVKGIPITEYCEEKRLGTRERLELFGSVCLAVQHAHQKGIIHRDLKPSNVLVALYDGQPVPKVIDFGVAKATGGQLTEKTLVTNFGSLVGTLEYMSPEQAELNQLDVDTRSDIYSLGVLLYELLTGSTPVDRERLRTAAFGEKLRMIREEEAETVSARIARTRSAELGARSNTSPVPRSPLPAQRWNELDWIVAKSLEKERSRRYESAAAFAADIQRYLHDEPVQACPPTAWYRFQKFARKHRPALATAAAVALCLILGTTVSAWQAVRATAAEEQAAANAVVANENAEKADEKAKEATQERDEAQKQRDEVKALADKLAAKEQQLQRTLYAAHMNLAHNAFEAGAPGRLRELLAQHRPQPGEADLRGFEWHYLNRLFPPDLLVLEHTGFVRSVAYNPDGKRLATRSQDGTIIVWDARTGDKRILHQGTRATVAFDTVTFSPDGKRVASSAGGSAKIWDAETGQELLSLTQKSSEFPSDTLRSPAFSPDGKRLATGSSRGQVIMWDAQTGERLLTLEGHSVQIRCLAFSPDGKRLASTSPDKTMKLWDSESGQLLHTLQGHADYALGVAFSPDGKQLASASVDKTVKLWDALSGNEIRTLPGHAGGVWSVAYSPDGKRLASASDDSTVKVWDVESGDELFALRGHTRGVCSVTFSPDGNRLASASEDGTVKVREAKAVQKALVLRDGDTDVTKVAFSPDGKRLASVGKRRRSAPYVCEAKVWDTQTGEQLLTIDAGNVDASLSLDGRRLAGGSGGWWQGRTEANIWDLLTGEKLLTLTIPSLGTPIFSFALSPDGNRFVTIAGGKVWDAKTGQELRSLKLKGPVNNIVFSLDGKRLAGITEDKTLKLWDSEAGDEILTLKGAAGSVAFSSDGKRVVSGSDDATVAKVWDVPTGEDLLSLKGHSGAITSVAFSPNNKRLATTSSDATIKVWDSETGQELLTLDGHSGRNNGVVFSPDGNRLAAGGPNGTVVIYDATPVEETR
jgi:WD40 repeat protein/serine/threonine protein kinase